MEQENGKKGLGTLEGVFTPTILTILGVVMYLRLGWVVGNVGLIETVIIILLAHSITICTALSMASMVSNIEIGAVERRQLRHDLLDDMDREMDGQRRARGGECRKFLPLGHG